MEQTANYGLNQWAAGDRIMREDFNADNTKVDQALGALAATVAGCGNCNVVYGSYVGTGTYQSANPCTLTFDGKPLLVVIFANVKGFDQLFMMQGSGFSFSNQNYSSSTVYVTWSGNSVSWYNNGSINCQMNKSDVTYYYVALLTAN